MVREWPLGWPRRQHLSSGPTSSGHEVSAAWPDHDSETAAALAASVAAHGASPTLPIILTAGADGQPQVLDGWYRLQEYPGRYSGQPE